MTRLELMSIIGEKNIEFVDIYVKEILRNIQKEKEKEKKNDSNCTH